MLCYQMADSLEGMQTGSTEFQALRSTVATILAEPFNALTTFCSQFLDAAVLNDKFYTSVARSTLFLPKPTDRFIQ